MKTWWAIVALLLEINSYFSVTGVNDVPFYTFFILNLIRLYNFLLEIGFLYKFQPGFSPGDSTVNQLLYIVHQIYCAFEAGKEVRVVFLDISTAFDRVCMAYWIVKKT